MNCPLAACRQAAIFGAFLVLAGLATRDSCCLEAPDSGSQARLATRLNSARAIKPSADKQSIDHSQYPLNSTKFPCSDSEGNALRVEYCARPLMDLVEGRVRVWPSKTEDMANLCNTFVESERCIRNLGRRCLKGLQRSIVSTIANAVNRVRKSECNPAKYPVLLQLSKCSQRHQSTTHSLMSNFSQYLTFVDADKDLNNIELKASRICCLTRQMPANLNSQLGQVCPDETPTVIRIYSLLLEDVLQMICARSDMSRCASHFGKFRPVDNLAIDHYNIIAQIISILFSMGS